MSLSNALSNAVSGIVAASRGTEVVASNLANAMTPGFARREVQLSARPWIGGGGGVHIEGVERVVRTAILGQSRTAGAETTRAQTLASVHKGMAEAIGVPGEAGALGTLLASFDAALISAAARPESETALNRVLTTAQALAGGYGTLGDRIQDARTEADRAIADDVRKLNEGLGRVVALNRQIVQQTASGGDVASLEDERQKVIDGLSKIMPIQELPRENGRVALFTSGGGVLLDGFTPVTFGFTPAGAFRPDMATGAPPVSGLTVDGLALSPGQMRSFSGGRLGANFQIRDVDAPAAQARVDGAARDLIERFADPAIDPTAPPGGGLYTDGGAPFTAANERGIAQRLAVADAIIPAAGGGLWRLRDGLGAATPGPVGQSALLDRMRGALTASRPTASPAVAAMSRSATTLAAEISSTAAVGRLDAEGVLAGAAAQSNSYETMLRQDGVDSDREMEALLALERAYAANAKVLQTVDDMLQTILRLT